VELFSFKHIRGMKIPNWGNSTGFILIWQTVLMYFVTPLHAI